MTIPGPADGIASMQGRSIIGLEERAQPWQGVIPRAPAACWRALQAPPKLLPAVAPQAPAGADEALAPENRDSIAMTA